MAFTYQQEMARKGIHLLSASFILLYIIVALFGGHALGLFALAVVLVILLEFEYFRVESKKKIPIISRFWCLKRPKEREHLGGEVFFLIGTIICLAVFDVRIAIAAVLMTTFGDLAAALIGKKFGRTWLNKRKKIAWEGIIAELVVNLIVGFLFLRTVVNGTVWWLGGSWGEPMWSTLIVMALVATTVETMIKKLDDNLLIPVFTGFSGQVVLIILTLFL